MGKLRENKIRASFWGPVGSLWALPQIWPHHFIAPCSAYFISKNQLSRPCSFRGVDGQILPLRENKIRASFWGPVGPLWALPQIWPHHFIALCSAYFISKNQLSRPRSFRGDRATNNTLPCVLLYVGWSHPPNLLYLCMHRFVRLNDDP